MATSVLKSQKHHSVRSKILNSKNVARTMAHATLLFTSVTSAGTMGPISNAPSLLQGLYIGLAGGGAFTTANETNSSTLDINFPNAHENTIDLSTRVRSHTKTHLYDNSGIGALLIGYGFEHKRLYLGLEGFLNYSKYQMHNSGSLSTTQRFSNNDQYYTVTNNWQVNTKVSPFQGGIDLRPGFFVTPSVLAYGLAGFSVAKVTQSANFAGTVVYNTSEAPPANDVYPFELNPHTSQSVVAWRLGAGFEYAINPSWAARINYVYVNYGNISSTNLLRETVTSEGTFGTGTLRVNSNVGISSIATNTIMLGVSHYFA